MQPRAGPLPQASLHLPLNLIQALNAGGGLPRAAPPLEGVGYPHTPISACTPPPNSSHPPWTEKGGKKRRSLRPFHPSSQRGRERRRPKSAGGIILCRGGQTAFTCSPRPPPARAGSVLRPKQAPPAPSRRHFVSGLGSDAFAGGRGRRKGEGWRDKRGGGSLSVSPRPSTGRCCCACLGPCEILSSSVPSEQVYFTSGFGGFLRGGGG